MLHKDIKTYVKNYNIYLYSKIVCYKLYGDLQTLLVLTYWWKDLFMNFIISLQISANQKDNSYNLTLVIINQLTKMIYYPLVKVTIDILDLV